MLKILEDDGTEEIGLVTPTSGTKSDLWSTKPLYTLKLTYHNGPSYNQLDGKSIVTPQAHPSWFVVHSTIHRKQRHEMNHRIIQVSMFFVPVI